MTDFLETNTDALVSRYPAFATEVLEAYPPVQFDEVTDAAGFPSAKYKGLWLHSTRAPVKEAERIASAVIENCRGFCIAAGFALGYYIEAVRKLRPEMPVIVIEPVPGLFISALKLRDLSSLLSSDKVQFVFDIKPSVIPSVLREAGAEKACILHNRALRTLNPEYYDELDSAVSGYCARKETNSNTLNKFGRLWVRNLFLNVSVFNRAGDISRLYGRFRGMPALLAAAGPSLDSVIPHIKANRDSFILICVDTAVNALLQNNITPDLIVIIDPQYLNTRHLDNCLTAFPETDSGGPFIVADSSTHPAALRGHRLPIFLCRSFFPLGSLFDDAAGIEGVLGAGGSVATSAWDLARRLGCGNIYCAGLDLGYPVQLSHSRYSMGFRKVHESSSRLRPAEFLSFRSIRNAGVIFCTNYSGGKTMTDNRLVIYSWWFSEQAGSDPVTQSYSLCSESLRLNGMEFAEPETLSKLPDICKEKVRIMRDCLAVQENALPDENNKADRTRRILEAFISESLEIEKLCSTAEEMVSRLKEDYSEEIIRSLDGIDKMLLNSRCGNISGFIIQPVLTELIDGGDDALESSELLYGSIRSSLKYHRKMAEKGLAAAAY